MPIVTIKTVEGRSQEEKRALAKEITESLGRNMNALPENVFIFFQESKHDAFANGGMLLSDQEEKYNF